MSRALEGVFLKLGGGLLTFKDQAAAVDHLVITRLAREIGEALTIRPLQLLLGHGGGCLAHGPAQRYQVHRGGRSPERLQGFAVTQDAVARLNRILLQALLEQGIRAVTFPPSAWMIADQGEPAVCFTEPIRHALELGLVPVVHGDAVLDRRLGVTIVSTETVFLALARDLPATRILVATRVDQVFQVDPASDPAARPVAAITAANLADCLPGLAGSAAPDVTGGMAHKVARLLRLAHPGVQCEIVGGAIPGNLRQALLDEPHVGTRIGGWANG